MAINFLNNGVFAGDIMPAAENLYDIGSASVRWEDIYGDQVYGRDVYVDTKIIHNGDTNNFISFAASRMILQSKASGAKIDLHDNGQLFLNSGGGTTLTLDTSQDATFAGSIAGTSATFDSLSAFPTLTLARSTQHAGVSFTFGVSNFAGAGADLLFDSVGNSTGFGFRTRNSSGNQQTALVIGPDGNVGVGVAVPLQPLHVIGAGLFTGLVSGITPVNAANFVTKAYVDGSGGGTGGPYLPLSAGSTKPLTGDLYISETGGNSKIRLSGTAGNNEIYEIQQGVTGISNGGFQINNISEGISALTFADVTANVGIGETSPDGKLHVHQTGSGTLTTIITEDDARKLFIGRDAINCKDLSNNNAVLFLNQAGGNVSVPNSSLGIGTTNPEKKLHIKTTTTDATPQVLVQNGNTGDASILLNVSGQSYVFGIDYDDSKKFKIASSSNLGTTDRVTLLSTGNVGIGTINPLGKLQINEYTVASQGNQGVHGELSVFANDGDESLFLGLKDSSYPNRGWAFNPVAFGINSSLQIKEHGSTSVRMTIKSGGNVGIGTTNPSAKLDVEDGHIRNTNNSSGDFLDIFCDGDGTGSSIISSSANDIVIRPAIGELAIKANAFGNTGGNGILKIYDGSTAFGVVKVQLNSSGSSYLNGGNVGIGTISPAEKLEVLGNIRANVSNTGGFMLTGASASGLVRNNASGVALRTNTTDRLIINNNGNLQLATYGAGTLVSDASGNITVSSGGGAGGPYLPLTAGSTKPLSGILYAGQGVKFTGGTIDSAKIVLHTNNVIYARGGSAGMFLQNADGSDGMFIANDHVRIETASAERMRITSAGNVGIGTTSPVATYDRTLHVKGVNPTVRIETNNVSGWAYNQYASPQGVWSVGINAPDQFHITNSASLGSNVRLCIDDGTGNVGIGTTTPGYKLSVNGDIQIPQNEYIYFDNTAHYIRRGSSDVELQGFNGLNLLTNGSSRLYINQTGNVGIGNTAPTYKLVLGGNGSLDDSIKIGTYEVAKDTRQYIGYARADTGLFETASSGNTPSTVLAGVAGMRIVNTAGSNLSSKADNSVQLLTHIYNGGSRVVLHADANGRVGIGTVTPSAVLSVVGTGNFTGLVSGITPTASNNFVTKAYVDGGGGLTGFLPLSAGGGFPLTGTLVGTSTNFSGNGDYAGSMILEME